MISMKSRRIGTSRRLLKQPDKGGLFSNIVAVTVGGLGDAVLFSPVFRALRYKFPTGKIDLILANRLAKEVYQQAEEINEAKFLTLKGRSRTADLFRLAMFSRGVRSHGSYHLAVLATGLNPWIGKVLLATRCVREVIYAERVPAYETDLSCNVALARHFNPLASEKDAYVPLSEVAKREARTALKECGLNPDHEDLIAVYPSRELPHRPVWPVRKWLEVTRILRGAEARRKVVVLGSERERAVWQAEDSQGVANAVFAGRLSLQGSAALVCHCKLTIGNDGGFMHVAGAVGSPLVVVMPNVPPSYRPPGVSTRVIYGDSSCCGNRYPHRPASCQVALCAEKIEVEEVLRACFDALIGTD